MHHQPLTNDQIRHYAPSVFATEPWDGVSNRYTFIPTINVVERLREEGFVPVRAEQSRCRIEGKREYTKHMLRFRRAQDLNIPRVVDGNAHHFFKVPPEIPEIVLVNAHDRTSAYNLDAGLFRLLCSNGLMVKSAAFENIHVRHNGNIVDEVIEGSYRIIEEMPRVLETVEQMRQISLAPPQQVAFANAALQLRWPEKEEGVRAAPIAPEQLLRVRRSADDKSDLWTTFNRVQENMLKGGLRGRNVNGGRTTTRQVKSVNEDVRLNKALWVLAEEMGRLAK